MYVSQLGKIIKAVKQYAEGGCQLGEVALVLDMPLNQLQTLLALNDIISLGGCPLPSVDYQDILNVIMLYYALVPFNQFTLTVFGNSSDGSVSATTIHEDARQRLMKYRDR